jgi:hypothetical protein
MAITHTFNDVCIPSFKPCVIAMFVYLRSSRVLLPCLYTFVQAVCYCHVCIPSFKPCVIAMFAYLRSSRVLFAWTKVYKHGNNTRLERRHTNMAITHGLNVFVYLRSSRVSLPCLYTFVQAVCYCHVCIPSFKLCVIAMFVYFGSRQ